MGTMSIGMRKTIMETMNNQVRMRVMDKDDGRWEIKHCMCGFVPSRWEFIGEHGRNSERWGEDDVKEHESSLREHWGEKDKVKHESSHHDDKDTKQCDEDYKKNYKGSHHDNKDVGISFLMGLTVGGILGGIMVAIICLAYQRK